MNNGANLTQSGLYTPTTNAMISSQMSLSTSMTQHSSQPPPPNTTNTSNSINNISLNMKSRFPRLQECAHFHYEVSTVDIPKNFKIILCAENDQTENCKPNLNNNTNINNTLTSSTVSTLSNNNNSLNSTAADAQFWYHLQVTSNDKKWIIYRTNENFKYLDKHLHDCIFDRKFSCLDEPISISSFAHDAATKTKAKTSDAAVKQLRQNMSNYLARFCEIAFINPINCGPILNWFEIDNRGNRLFAIDDSPINIPGVAAAVVKKRYVAQGLDEISLDVGNMISVIDMPPHDESVWWRGKKELEVGFFPFECVELIKCNQHLSSNVTEHLPKLNQNQSVRLKHGKLITLLRSFFNTRPARNQLQSKGILKQRVFACDLGEHLSNTQQEIPKILTICTEFIEKHGIVDGIYRHTGLQSNIQRLRNAFDEERFHEIEQEIYINDVHAVSSLLKMYFRELPNPLLTYQLYHKFIKSVNVEDKIFEIHDVVQQLPPPHYRTLAFLMNHLHRLSESSPETNMNTKNLAIVWAPNLLKSKEMDQSSCMQLDMLHSITLQANISEFLIANADTIFNDKFASLVRKDPKSNVPKYRPISVCYNTGGTKLLSLEEAQDKYKQVGPAEIPKYHTVIEIPDHKKKKQKDKKSNLNANNSIVQPPANIHIQQQFETLQQQQQQQQQQCTSQLKESASFNSVTSQQQTPQYAVPSTTNNTNSNNNGSSSPAFISLFRNLRGSLKHQQGSSSDTNSSFRQSTLNQTPIQNYENEPNSTTPVAIGQNISKLNRTNSNSTFKATSPTNDIKNDYSNCISQLQSAAAQAINSSLHQQNSYLTGSNLSPSEIGTHYSELSNSAPAPVLYRNNKFNQSVNSNHSNNNNNQHLNTLLLKLNENSSNHQNNQPIMSTFKDSSQSIVNNAVIDTRKSEATTNPIPSKRRTIQGQPSILSNSNTLTTFAQQPAKTNTPQYNTLTKSISHDSDTSNQHNEYNKENQIQHQNNEDDMQQLVEYINQFEKENITTAAENVNNSFIEMTPIIQQQTTSGPAQQSATSIIDIDAIETSSKLRLSASSLSSSESSSNDANNDYDDIFANHDDLDPKTEISTIKITSNETNPMIVSTSNLNSILTSSNNTDKIRSNYISSQFIDRRTYIINKVYDNLENNAPKDELSDEEVEENEDQYEKVVLTHQRKLQPEIENDYGEYHNDLLVSNYNTPISQQSNNMIKIVGKPANTEVTKDHIYVNVEFEKKLEPLIRESLGFEVQELIQENNPIEHNEIVNKNFDTELVEINNQINQLLYENKPIVQEIQLEPCSETQAEETSAKVEVRRPKSVAYPNKDSKIPNDLIKRRTTLASYSSNAMDTNKYVHSDIIEPNPIINKVEEPVKTIKPVPLRSNSCSIKSKPIDDKQLKLRESSDSINKLAIGDLITPLKAEIKHHEVRHSFRFQSANDPNTNESNEIDENSSDLNFKRKSSHSFDELNRKKSETFDSDTETKSNQFVKSRQSVQISNVSQDTNLTNTNNKTISKSLQDNSKAVGSFTEFKQLQSDSSSCLSKENSFETNETNVKSKIKLMESIVGSNFTHVPNLKFKKGERSSSISSNSSSSSSKSPPLSPHLIINSIVKSDTSSSLTSNCETKSALQAITNNKQNPPIVMARSIIWQPAISNDQNESLNKESEKIFSVSENLPLKTNEIVMDTEVFADPIIITTKSVQALAKEKRRTVKEMISKFEPK